MKELIGRSGELARRKGHWRRLLRKSELSRFATITMTPGQRAVLLLNLISVHSAWISAACSTGNA